jgi:uncharacterized ferritin-like protein (DUF455 family)
MTMRPDTDFFELAESCLYVSSLEDKLAAADRAAQSLGVRDLAFDFSGSPRPASAVLFPDRPRLVDPRDLPRRSLSTVQGKIAFLHALAHIEFTAIQLAFDIAYRFRGLPERFYYDWLGVAVEEAAHFRMLRGRLAELGADYGELPAHRGLWDVAEDTAEDVLARLALVPRFMEARGLDVTPAMIARLEQVDDEAGAAILRVILADEVGHVALGSRWFALVCGQRGLDPEQAYFALLEKYLRGRARGPFNLELRRVAGFSEGELSRLDVFGSEGSERAG